MKKHVVGLILLASQSIFADTGCFDIQGREMECFTVEKPQSQIDFESKLSQLDRSTKQKYLAGYMQIIADTYSPDTTNNIGLKIPNDIGNIKLNKKGEPSFFSKSKLQKFLKENKDIDLIYQQYKARMKGFNNNNPLTPLEMEHSSNFKEAVLDESKFPFYKLYVMSQRGDGNKIQYFALKMQAHDYKNLLNWIVHDGSGSVLQVGTALAVNSLKLQPDIL